MHRSSHHWLFTVAAVFLLLFTAGDLAYPQMCAEDGDEATAIISTGATTLATVAAPDASPENVPAHADDCFCCCGHVIAGAMFHVAMPRWVAETRLALSAQSVSVAPMAPFHPPRLG